ncbi:hypothetical protein LU632_05640 [Erwinia tracheiphila]|nr:hypothetical protein [Erwinia tracheiphila]UIA93056.1 hypothetical protein LU632_05640 [Erwinia tracheiphila]
MILPSRGLGNTPLSDAVDDNALKPGDPQSVKPTRAELLLGAVMCSELESDPLIFWTKSGSPRLEHWRSIVGDDLTAEEINSGTGGRFHNHELRHPDDLYSRYSTDASAIPWWMPKLLTGTSWMLRNLTTARKQLLQIALDDASATIDGYIDQPGNPAVKNRSTGAESGWRVCWPALPSKTVRPRKKQPKTMKMCCDCWKKSPTGDISLGLSKEAERPDGGDVAMMSSAGSVFSRRQIQGVI